VSKPTIKVELEVDETATILPFFTLNDPEAGVLDNEIYPLGGLGFVDVSEQVAGITVKRGISRELERTNAGVATVSLNNDTRLFDPENPESNFSSQLLPHRQLRITVDGTTPVYLGLVDDWNIQYDLRNNNLSIANCVDKFTLLAQQILDEFSVPSELSGSRMERILDRPEVSWSVDERAIDAGSVNLLAGTVAFGTNALDYLNSISFTEDGAFFIAKDGKATLQDGLTGPSTSTLINFSDQGDGIPFTDIEVVYGSELLYNRIEITNIQGITLIGDSFQSQTKYGITALSKKDYQGSIFDAATLIISLLNRYDEPEYRFEKIVVELTNLPSAEQQLLLNAELTTVANIKFRPNGIGPIINKFAQIIGIAHEITSSQHRMEFRFRTLDFAPFVLDDLVFGTLGGSLETYDQNDISYDDNIEYDGTESDSGNRLG
jgi:hypothetical protein